MPLTMQQKIGVAVGVVSFVAVLVIVVIVIQLKDSSKLGSVETIDKQQQHPPNSSLDLPAGGNSLSKPVEQKEIKPHKSSKEEKDQHLFNIKGSAQNGMESGSSEDLDALLCDGEDHNAETGSSTRQSPVRKPKPSSRSTLGSNRPSETRVKPDVPGAGVAIDDSIGSLRISTPPSGKRLTTTFPNPTALISMPNGGEDNDDCLYIPGIDHVISHTPSVLNGKRATIDAGVDEKPASNNAAPSRGAQPIAEDNSEEDPYADMPDLIDRNNLPHEETHPAKNINVVKAKAISEDLLISDELFKPEEPPAELRPKDFQELIVEKEPKVFLQQKKLIDPKLIPDMLELPDDDNFYQRTFIQLLKELMDECKGNVWILQSGKLAPFMKIPVKDVKVYLFREPQLQDFYWECSKAMFLHKYLADGQCDDKESVRELLIYALNSSPSDELENNLNTALGKLNNPYYDLNTFIEQNQKIAHISDLPADKNYLQLLKEALSLESLQCKPTILSRVKILYQEAQLEKRVERLLSQDVFEIDDQVEKDFKEVLDNPKLFRLSRGQLDELQACLI